MVTSSKSKTHYNLDDGASSFLRRYVTKQTRQAVKLELKKALRTNLRDYEADVPHIVHGPWHDYD